MQHTTPSGGSFEAMRTAEYPKKLPTSTILVAFAFATASSRIRPLTAPMEYMGYFWPKHSKARRTAAASPGAAHVSIYVRTSPAFW